MVREPPALSIGFQSHHMNRREIEHGIADKVRGCEGFADGWFGSRSREGEPALREARKPAQRPPSLFKLIRGIVRGTDSLRPARAQHMKKHAETIESYD